jgi:hypothetical protein
MKGNSLAGLKSHLSIICPSNIAQAINISTLMHYLESRTERNNAAIIRPPFHWRIFLVEVADNVPGPEVNGRLLKMILTML